MTLKPESRLFEIEAGRAYEYFRDKLGRSLSEEQLSELLNEMLAVIRTFEHQLFEYRGRKVYLRNILLNKHEWLEKFKK